MITEEIPVALISDRNVDWSRCSNSQVCFVNRVLQLHVNMCIVWHRISLPQETVTDVCFVSFVALACAVLKQAASERGVRPAAVLVPVCDGDAQNAGEGGGERLCAPLWCGVRQCSWG